jgi:glycosyltransferase involved in cell wall biosynthesis
VQGIEDRSASDRLGVIADRPRRSVSVLIPAHNEAEILETTVVTVVRRLRDVDVDWFELIICENGSSDGTLAIGMRLAREIPEVALLSLTEPDYGAAMRAGFLAARGDVIVNFDADYYDLDFLSQALEEDADIVIAAKGLEGSEDTRVLLRRLASRTFVWLVRAVLELRVTETHGMKVFHRCATQDLAMQVRSTKDLFDTELLARAEWSGLAIRQLPIRTVEMRHSRSGILRRVPRTIWGLVQIRLAHRAVRRAQEPTSAPRVMEAA